MALKLPLSITSTQDLHRLVREVEALDNFVRQSAIRGQKLTNLPRLTNTLEVFLRDNQMDALDEGTRTQLLNTLASILSEAPTVHMSFAVEPPASMTQQIVGWFRENVHPAVMLQIGIQPTIAAGCVLRTPNKFFDFSLRQHLKRNQGKLMESIQKHSSVAVSGVGKEV